MSNNALEAGGSITIHRLRSGDTIAFVIRQSVGKPWAQFVDLQTGGVTPDWADETNRPTATPSVMSSRSNAVGLTGHTWKYNGSTLVFNGTPSGDWVPNTGGPYAGFFAINGEGAIKPLVNLASADNYGPDNLVYEGTARIAGVEQPVRGELTVNIQPAGVSAYSLGLAADSLDVGATGGSEITATLLNSAGNIVTENITYEWKINSGIVAGETGSTLTVSRGDIAYIGSIICIAKENGTAVASAGIYVYDTKDNYKLIPYTCNAEGTQEVPNTGFTDTNETVYVTARLVKVADNTTVTPSGEVTWSFYATDKTSFVNVKEQEGGGSVFPISLSDLAEDTSGVDILVTLNATN